MAENQGMNQIRQELNAVNFPVTKNDLMNKMGDRQINAGQKNMKMRDVLGRVQRDRYESQDDLMNDIRSNVPEFRS